MNEMHAPHRNEEAPTQQQLVEDERQAKEENDLIDAEAALQVINNQELVRESLDPNNLQYSPQLSLSSENPSFKSADETSV
jgi:hypothetical protein